ncbi:MAG: tetratricopeptide repeat protein [Desulfovibrio sp.]|nr:tetratricopeptide repeat protein [Desulfovibrio sp.]
MKARYDDIDEYIRDLREEIKTNDKCANHYYNLGLAFLSKRDFVAAEDAFLKAVENSPRLAEAYVQLGGICQSRGDLDGCLRYNEEAANLRPKFAIPQSNIAYARLQKGEPDKAMEAIAKALQWNPNFTQAKNALGIAHYMKKEYGEAEKVFLDLLREQPEFAPAWHNLSLNMFDQGRFDEAVEASDRAANLGYEIPEGFLKELEPYRKRS